KHRKSRSGDGRHADRPGAQRQRETGRRAVELLRVWRYQRFHRVQTSRRVDQHMTNLMQGKRGLIMGVANDHSIAWGIAKALSQHGAALAFTYQGEALGRRVKPLAESVNSN